MTALFPYRFQSSACFATLEVDFCKACPFQHLVFNAGYICHCVHLCQLCNAFDFNFILQTAKLPSLRRLSKELLLDVLDALADEMSDSHACQDMSGVSLTDSNMSM